MSNEGGNVQSCSFESPTIQKRQSHQEQPEEGNDFCCFWYCCINSFNIPHSFIGVSINVVVVGDMIGIHLMNAILWKNYIKAPKIFCCLCWVVMPIGISHYKISDNNSMKTEGIFNSICNIVEVPNFNWACHWYFNHRENSKGIKFLFLSLKQRMMNILKKRCMQIITNI